MNPSLTSARGQPPALDRAAMKAGLGLLIPLATSFFPLLAQIAEKPKRNLLFVGQAKGYQHEAISTAMATLYNLGRSSGLWNTVLRTDCTAITKKPLKWEAKNLDAFDAIVFFTDGELDMAGLGGRFRSQPNAIHGDDRVSALLSGAPAKVLYATHNDRRQRHKC